jgi:hypothetical protein
MLRRATLYMTILALLTGLVPALAWGAPPAQPAPLSIAPLSGPPGAVVQYSGSGFTPGGRVSVLLIEGLGLIVDEPVAAADGNVQGSFTMPEPVDVAELLFGPVAVFAIDEVTGQETPRATFTLTERPAMVPVATWYFAEGSSQPPFDTWFLVQNPTNQTARVRFTFQMQPDVAGPQTVVRDYTVGATSRLSVFANEVVPDRAFSTRIDSDRAIFNERSMFVGFDGHVVAGIPAPGTQWLFAEGSSQPPFHTWLLLQNPNAEVAAATITYFVQGGAPRIQTVSLPANSRTSVFTNEVVPDAAFSMQVDGSLPIIAERAMYRFPGNAATGVAGVTATSRSWFFAEGNESARGLPTDTWLLLQNPHPSTVSVTITVVREAGDPVELPVQLAPSSRQSILLNELGDFGSFGIRVEAGAEIVAERSMFIGVEPRGAHATVGSPVLASTWYLAEGSTAPPFDQVIAIMNPSGQDAVATVEFQLPGGQRVTANFAVLAQRKLSILVDDMIPNSAVSARVSTSVPTVVERTMFFEKLGGVGMHNTIGIR